MEEIKLHDNALYQNLRYAFKELIFENCDKMLDTLMLVVEPLIKQLERDLEAYKTIKVSSTTPVIIDSYLEKFKSLQHIAMDTMSTTCDYGFMPTLYYHDRMWHVDWMNDENGSIKEFSGETPEEVIDMASEWFHSTYCNS